MKHKGTIFIIIFMCLTLGFAGPVWYGPCFAQERSQSFRFEDYAAVLKDFVNHKAMVNYRGLKSNRERLDAFIKSMGDLEADHYKQWNTKEKTAFWINAYNALTLKAIIDHYPIKPSFFASLAYPKNSIRQISGVWDKLKFPVMGREITLEHIEHQILRREFNEPRIHMALVCAAMGCPPLRGGPYTGGRLDAQLDEQTDLFLENPAKFRIDRTKGIVYLSPIFDWFGKDFVKTYGTDLKFSGHTREERAVLNFISEYLKAKDREYLASTEYKIEYLDYDWSLNEQKN